MILTTSNLYARLNDYYNERNVSKNEHNARETTRQRTDSARFGCLLAVVEAPQVELFETCGLTQLALHRARHRRSEASNIVASAIMSERYFLRAMELVLINKETASNFI